MTDPRHDNAASGIYGEPDAPVTAEADHFYACTACGQAVDKRDLGAVLHHEEPGHAPLPVS
jgi:hypothetical protein